MLYILFLLAKNYIITNSYLLLISQHNVGRTLNNLETFGREMRKQDEITKYVLFYLIILDHVTLPDFSQIRKMLQQMNGIAEDGLAECNNCRSLAFQTSHPSFLSLEL
jgi:hypothetical protein